MTKHQPSPAIIAPSLDPMFSHPYLRLDTEKRDPRPREPKAGLRDCPA
jgi:hypothetical protein